MTDNIVDLSKFKKKPFKTPQGVFILGGLFFEQSPTDKSNVIYTLKDNDHLGYPSLRRLYLEMGDPTEYFFALKHMDGWAHWERLCECEWFSQYLNRWRRELELCIRAKALIRIMALSENPNSKEAFGANKFLLAANWKPTARVGRPNKEDIKEAAYDVRDVKDDVKRMSEYVAN